MGRLIKNHLARLIVLTAATCRFSMSWVPNGSSLTTIRFFRSSRCWSPWSLLAKGIFRYLDEGARCHRHSDTDNANLQHHLRTVRTRLGIPVPLPDSQHCPPPIDSRSTCGVPNLRLLCGDNISRNERGAVLRDWNGCLLLGIQRGRGTHNSRGQLVRSHFFLTFLFFKIVCMPWKVPQRPSAKPTEGGRA
jgi:hypothetical protein